MIAWIAEHLSQLAAGKFSLDYLVITKALKSHYDNPEQIVHKVLAKHYQAKALRLTKRRPLG